MLYNVTMNKIDLTKYDGRVVVSISVRDSIFPSEWDKMSSHGEEGVWYAGSSGYEASTTSLKPLIHKTEDGEEIEDERLYELTIIPSVDKNVLKSHNWLIYYWKNFGVGMRSAVVSITERHDGPWDINFDYKVSLSGYFMNANVVADVNNS
jgi:hypothetical protein